MPAQAGIQVPYVLTICMQSLDPRLRGDDVYALTLTLTG